MTQTHWREISQRLLTLHFSAPDTHCVWNGKVKGSDCWLLSYKITSQILTGLIPSKRLEFHVQAFKTWLLNRPPPHPGHQREQETLYVESLGPSSHPSKHKNSHDRSLQSDFSSHKNQVMPVTNILHCVALPVPRSTLSYIHTFTPQNQPAAIKTDSHTETAHKCLEFNKMVHVVIQKPERPSSEDLRVGPAGPRRDKLEQVCKLLGIYAVLLCVGPAGVMAKGHGPGLLPVTAQHVFSLE